MKAINKPGDNLGGLLKMWAVPRSDFSISGTTVTFSDTTNIYEIYCSQESMRFDDHWETTKAGLHYNVQITGFIPGDNSENLAAMNDMKGKPYVIIFQNGNGKYKLAGTLHQPLYLDATLDTGTQVSDRSGYLISFRPRAGITTTSAVFIDNPF